MKVAECAVCAKQLTQPAEHGMPQSACARVPSGICTGLDSTDTSQGILTSRNFWLTSFSTTSMPATSVAVAMPLPMSPPPSTATILMGRGLRSPSVMPVTCAAHLVRIENMNGTCTRPQAYVAGGPCSVLALTLGHTAGPVSVTWAVGLMWATLERTRCVARCPRKVHTSALCTGSDAARTKHSASCRTHKASSMSLRLMAAAPPHAAQQCSLKVAAAV